MMDVSNLPEYLDHTHKVGIMDPTGLNHNPLTNEVYSDTYKAIAAKWSELPGYQRAEDILTALHTSQLTIAVMGTGTGKTVLIPKFALHYTAYRGKVGITLPKRSVTLSSALFSALASDVKIGKQIGYVYKGSKKEMAGPDNKIVHMTDGVLTMKMVNDPYLSEYKVIIIDEAHERKAQIDLILLFLKKLLLSGRRPDLKVILMSATIDSNKYARYFEGVKTSIVKVEGKPNYPIETIFLEKPVKDYLSAGKLVIDNLMEQKIKKDMLFFITTSKEAMDMCRYVRPKYPKMYCIEAFADMDERLVAYVQDKTKYMETGNYEQKMVMATNVAESSLTIDGLKYVIDSCYELYSYFDPNTAGSILETRLITKSQAEQRRGRVGRTEPGICYHLLTESQFKALEEFQEPDIVKQDLTMDFLKLISQSEGRSLNSGYDILKQLMDVPKKIYVDYAVRVLSLYKILSPDGLFEPKLGSDVLQYSSLPLNQSLFLIYAFQLYCGKEAAVIVGMLEVCKGRMQNFFIKDDVMCNSDCKKDAKKYMAKVAHKKSDHLTLLAIFNDFQNATDKEKWCKSNRIKMGMMRAAKEKSHQYFHKLLSNVKAPQIGGAEKVDVKKRLVAALDRSHQHQIARNLKSTFAKLPQEGQIQQSSFLLQHHSKKDLAKKKFLYDQLVCTNGSWEFGVITLLSSKS